MRLHDTLSGLFALLFGLAVIVVASRFPPTPGQSLGPGLFPIVIGGGLALGGIVMIASGWRQRASGLWIAFDESVRSPRRVLNAALVVGALVFYALAVETLGFFVTAFAFLAALFLAFGVRRRWIAPLAAAVTFALHLAFYTFLRVPLPWGWLEGMAW